jgi:hypothetical protein
MAWQSGRYVVAVALFGLWTQLTLRTHLAWAAAPTTLAVDGVLTNAAGGPVADGAFEFNVALYASDAGGVAGWQEKSLLAVVKNGAFRLTLGQMKPLDGTLAADHPWIGVAVVGEPELPRRPLHAVPFALRAGQAEALACSGCVTPAQLDPKWLASLAKQADLTTLQDQLATVAKTGAYADLKGAPDLGSYAKTGTLAAVASTGKYADLNNVPTLPKLGTACGTGLAVSGLGADGSLQCVDLASAFVSTKGGTIDGKLGVTQELALGTAAITGGRFAALDVAKAACEPLNLGQVTIHLTNKRLYFCDGTAWRRLSVCNEVCLPAAAVACGQPIANSCGETGGCPGTGSACATGQSCVAGKCVGIGSSQDMPALSCADALKADPTLASGTVWIDPNGPPTADAFQVACEQSVDGGGWTGVASFASAGPDAWSYYNGNWSNDSTFADNDFKLIGGSAIDRKFKSWGTVPFKEALFVSQDGSKFHVMTNFKDQNLSFTSAKAAFAAGGNWLWANKKASAGGGMWDYPNWAFNNVEVGGDQCWNARINVCKQTYVNHTGGGSLIGTACNGGGNQNADLAKDSIGTLVYNCVQGGAEPQDLSIAADAYYAMFVR